VFNSVVKFEVVETLDNFWSFKNFDTLEEVLEDVAVVAIFFDPIISVNDWVEGTIVADNNDE